MASVTRTVSPVAGTNQLHIKLTSIPNGFLDICVTATDAAPPVLTVTAPADSTTTNQTSIATSGTVSDKTHTTVKVNGVSATIAADSTWTATVPLPTEGWQTLTYVATDAAGLSTTVVRQIRRDTQAPALTVTTPLDNSFTRNATATVAGTVVDASPVTVNSNGTPLTVTGTTFTGSVALAYGINTLVTTATDIATNAASVIRTVTRDTLPPVLTVATPLEGATTSSDSVVVSGTVTDAAPVTVMANGVNLPVTGTSYSGKIALAQGPNAITVVATDAATNAATVVRNVTRGAGTGTDTIPPDPATVAPPLPSTGMAAFVDATSFLYTGANTIQTGVVAGTMDPKRVAVIRGKVVARDGGVVPGVHIDILNHPEFGETHSRADGRFDLAVNGGGQLVVQYTKSGYLPAQRQLGVPWQDYVALDSVALVRLDTVATAIDLAAGTPVQVAQSSVVQDADGSRHTAVMVKAGTQATMRLPNGTTQALTTITVRATEYTVGPQGPAAMPAALPPTTAYTYATELGIDEAVAAGATNVTFSQPLPVYLDNFLGVPTGRIIPVGSYDRQRAVWVPEENGRVVKILSAPDGVASLDVDGSSQTASQAALDSLGINTAELERLAVLYPVGKSLWRMRTTHFTTFDYNFQPPPPLPNPPGPPRGASGAGPFPWGNGGGGWPPWPFPPIGPGGPGSAGPGSPGGPGGPDTPDDRLPGGDPNTCNGSIIECENSILGERLVVPGTPFTLNYRSDRVPGNRRAYELTIPVIGASVPPALVRADVDVTVAGKTVTATFPASENQSFRFIWDGKDAYGRTVRGQQRMSVRVHHIYPFVYYTTTESAKAFGQPCLGDAAPAGPVCVVASQWSRTAERVQTYQYPAVVGSVQPRGLGGWTLSPNHLHDPVAEMIHLGTGERQQVMGYTTATVLVGTGVQGYSGDGSAATAANVNNPTAVAVAPNGDVYFGDQFGTLLRRVTAQGIVGTVGGTTTACTTSCGDGGPVGQAGFGFVRALTFGPDGTLFVADSLQHRVRRIDPDGIIRPWAGSGAYCDHSSGFANCGDGAPAQVAALHPKGLAIAADGDLLIASNRSIWRVRADSTIQVVAGIGGCGQTSGLPDCGDEGPARQAKVDPIRLASRPDGGYYFTEKWNGRVRFVDRTGIIHQFAVAGNCGSEPSCGDGGPATQSLMAGPGPLAFGPDGSLFVGEFPDGGMRLRRIGADGIVTTFGGVPQDTRTTPGWFPVCPADQTAKSAGWWAVGESLCAGAMEIAVGPDGRVIVTSPAARVLQIAPAITSPTPTQVSLGSSDGTEIYRFDATGRHLDTRDAQTGLVLFAFGYEPNGGLISVSDKNGQTTTVERDGAGKPIAIASPLGRRTTLTLDANGFLARLVGQVSDTILVTHDSAGMLLGLRDPNGFLHTFSYDSTGRLTVDQNPGGGSTASAKVEDSTGFSVDQTTAMGRTRKYGVHRLSDGSLARTAREYGSTVTTVARSDGGILISERSGMTLEYKQGPHPVLGLQAPQITSLRARSPSGRIFTFATSGSVTKDSLNPQRVLATRDTVWLDSQPHVTAYDASLRKYTGTSPTGRQTTFTVDSLDRVVQTQVPGLTTASLAYDTLGRVSQITEGGRSLRYSYDAEGNLVSIMDPLDRITSFVYDAAGRQTGQTNPGSGTVEFGYDRGGRLTSITPPGRSAHEFTYTPTGGPAAYNPPSVGAGDWSTTYEHNADAQLTKIVRPTNDSILFHYDTVGRLAGRTFSRGSLGVESVAVNYSASTGVIASITSSAGTNVSFAYDGVVPTAATWSGLVTGTVSRGYGATLRVDTIHVNGVPIGMSYDMDGFLTSVGALRLARRPDNGLIQADTLGSVTGSWSFDGRAALVSYAASVGGGPLYEASYVRDSLLRTTSVTESVQGSLLTRAFTYDNAGRVGEVWEGGVLMRVYQYDENGNRLGLTGPGLSINATYDAQDRLLTYGTANYSYDRAGVLIQRVQGLDTTRYTYDAQGSLLRVTLPNSTVIDYVVDGQSLRVGKKINGVWQKRWLWQSPLAPAAELDSNGAVAIRFVYATRGNVPDYMVKNGQAFRLITDQLGSVRLVVNANDGSVAQRIDYDEFGSESQNTNPGFQPFGYAGGFSDEHTGLVRFGARDYDPTIGRWTAKDPMAFSAGSPNLYEYVRNDPINLQDPTGLCAGETPDDPEKVKFCARVLLRIEGLRRRILKYNEEVRELQRAMNERVVNLGDCLERFSAQDRRNCEQELQDIQLKFAALSNALFRTGVWIEAGLLQLPALLRLCVAPPLTLPPVERLPGWNPSPPGRQPPRPTAP